MADSKADSKADSDGPPRAVLIAALLVAVGALGVILAIAATRHRPTPVVIAAVPAPHAQDPACQKLLEVLPQRLGDYVRAPVVQPAPVGVRRLADRRRRTGGAALWPRPSG
jgi:hypothetical protein